MKQQRDKQPAEVEYLKCNTKAERLEKSRKKRKKRVSKDALFEQRWK